MPSCSPRSPRATTTGRPSAWTTPLPDPARSRTPVPAPRGGRSSLSRADQGPLGGGPGTPVGPLNIALPLEPLTSDRLAGFVEILEPVNALADRCPGFVWRLQTEDGDATAVRGFGDDRLIVDLTVWTSLEALGAYVHGGFHADVMRRREWVTHLREAYTALWWVPADVRPTVGDAELRLAALRERGPTPYAFTVKRPFAAPGSVVEQSSDDDWFCRA